MKRTLHALWSALVLPAVLALATLPQAHAQHTDTWTGTDSGNWNHANNWAGNLLPQSGDALVFGSSASGTTLNNDFSAGMGFSGLTFNGAAFTLNGNGIVLSGNTNGTTIGLTNASGVAQAVGMPLSLDWGAYSFSSPLGGSLALNGGLTLGPASIALFDSAVSSTTLTADGTGLIAGLGGRGLVLSGSPAVPSGLAAMSGGAIVPYSGFTSYTGGGALASSGTANIQLTDSGASATYSANGIAVNTITVSQAGDTGGATTTTLNNTGTLGLGQNGGLYVLNSAAGASNCFLLSGGTLTAGPAGTPSTLVLGANGTAGIQSLLTAAIANNGTGGTVTLVTMGSGSQMLTKANTHSGGTYVTQGQLELGNVAGAGTGPLYVGPGATVAYTNTGTIANNISLSPGTGGLLGFGNTFSGTLTLLGPAVPAGSEGVVPGDRMGDNVDNAAHNPTFAFNNPLTGPGTLEIQGSFSAYYAIKNAGDNWQGGLVIDPPYGVTAYVRCGASGVIPNGPNAGNLTLISQGSSWLSRFDLNGAHTETINGLIAPANGNELNQIVGNFQATGAATLTLGANGNNNGGPFTFNGLVTDAGANYALSLVKIGTGGQTLASPNPNPYHGITTVSSGTLALAKYGSIPNSPTISVAAGATLDVSGLNSPFDLGGNYLGGYTAQTLRCLGTVTGAAIVDVSGTIDPFSPTLGTYTNNGALTLNPGGSYVWRLNNAAGTAGGDPGWSLVNVQNGSLTIGAYAGAPFNIEITSMNGDVAGSAANFNPATPGSWPILQADSAISGFDPTAFNLDTSAFQNAVGAGTFSLQLSGDQKSILLVFTPAGVICSPLVNQTNVAGTTAQFTAGVCAGSQPATYQWYFNSNPVNNGDPSGSGSTIQITSTGSGSTLSIPNAADGDVGTYSVTATGNLGGNESSSATLTVIDPPANPNVTPSMATLPVSAGAVDTLNASASGTAPFTYQWYLNGNAIPGATNSSFAVNVSPASLGSYTVRLTNPAGNVIGGPFVVSGPICLVPNQILYEPFNYPLNDGLNPYTWTAPGLTNLYNQQTGVGLTWTTVGKNDFATRANNDFGSFSVGPIDTFDGYLAGGDQGTWLTYPPGAGNRPLLTDQYPVEGLAGNSANLVWCTTDQSGGQENLHFGTGGDLGNGAVYVSFVIQLSGFDANGVSGNHMDYLCGLGTGATNSTTRSVGIFINRPWPPNTWPDIGYTLGVFKGNLTPSQLDPTPGTGNGGWAPGAPSLDYDILFVVMRYNIDPGGHSTCDLWVNPARNSFYTNEANVPAPTVANVGGGVADVPGTISLFWTKATTYPVSRNLLDVRVGTTWAAVTPPAAPTLSLPNVLLRPTDTVAVFRSQNAGNPVSSGATAGNPPYQWEFTPPGGSPRMLSDGTGPSGHSTLGGSGTDTLTLANPAPGDLGTYTLTEINTSPSAYDAGMPDAGYVGPGLTYTNTVSALLTTNAPRLSVTAGGGIALISWPVNWAVALESTTSLVPPITWTPVSGGGSSFVYWPPGSGLLSSVPVPITTSGGNYMLTVVPGSTSQRYFRLAPSPSP